jgi:hypothetical protein
MGPGPEEDDRFRRYLSGAFDEDERRRFAERLAADAELRERLADYYFVKHVFVPAVNDALAPTSAECGPVRGRFARGSDGLPVAPSAADLRHRADCPACALAWTLYANGDDLGPPPARRRGPAALVVVFAAGAALLFGRGACGSAGIDGRTRPELIAAAESDPTVERALRAVSDRTLADAARRASAEGATPAEKSEAIQALRRAATPEAAALGWALAATEPDPSVRRSCYLAVEGAPDVDLRAAVAALRRETAAADPRNIDLLLALVRRRGAAPARPVLLDLVRTAAERPGAFAEATQLYDQTLYALPDDAEAIAAVEAATNDSDRLRSAAALYALAARSFAEEDDRALDMALSRAIPLLASPDPVVANRAATAFERFAKGRHLADVVARGVVGFEDRWKVVLQKCAERDEFPIPRS